MNGITEKEKDRAVDKEINGGSMQKTERQQHGKTRKTATL